MDEQTRSRASSSDDTLMTSTSHEDNGDATKRDPKSTPTALSKIEQNRQAQRLFRQRRKEYIQSLEKQVLAIESLESEARILNHKNHEMIKLLENQKSLFDRERGQWISERADLYKIIQNLEFQLHAITKKASVGLAMPVDIHSMGTPIDSGVTMPRFSLPIPIPSDAVSGLVIPNLVPQPNPVTKPLGGFPL